MESSDLSVILPPALTRRMVFFFALCCGAIVANIYYAQPVIGLIAPDIGLSIGAASMIVSLTQMGYGLGLFFLVPLGDLVENRKLMIMTVLLACFSLAVAAMSHDAGIFLVASLCIGVGSVAVQMIIPLAAHLAPEHSRGRTVGSIMSGLLLGILLARPASSLLADHFGWRAVFAMAAVLMGVIIVLLLCVLPRRQPSHKAHYFDLLKSLGALFCSMPVLRERALYQACMFASFSLFWTAVPLELAVHYHLTQTQIALFALVGATGAIAAPISGRLADAGYTIIATRYALLGGACAMFFTLLEPHIGIAGLAAAGVLLDFAVQMNIVLGQRAIYALDAANRSRLNGLYMASIFAGGAIGSALASLLFTQGGWAWVAIAGGAFPLLALIVFLTKQRIIKHTPSTSADI